MSDDTKKETLDQEVDRRIDAYLATREFGTDAARETERGDLRRIMGVVAAAPVAEPEQDEDAPTL